jgi:hypothetical protein
MLEGKALRNSVSNETQKMALHEKESRYGRGPAKDLRIHQVSVPAAPAAQQPGRVAYKKSPLCPARRNPLPPSGRFHPSGVLVNWTIHMFLLPDFVRYIALHIRE